MRRRRAGWPASCRLGTLAPDQTMGQWLRSSVCAAMELAEELHDNWSRLRAQGGWGRALFVADAERPQARRRRPGQERELPAWRRDSEHGSGRTAVSRRGRPEGRWAEEDGESGAQGGFPGAAHLP